MDTENNNKLAFYFPTNHNYVRGYLWGELLKKPEHPHLWTGTVILFLVVVIFLFIPAIVPVSSSLLVFFSIFEAFLISLVIILAYVNIFYASQTSVREKIERKLKQYPLAPYEYAAKHPLRCKEIKGGSWLGAALGHETWGYAGDRIAFLCFTKDKLLVVVPSHILDAIIGSRGTNVDDFGDIPMLFVGRDEQTIMRVAKDSYSIPFASIRKVEVKKWMKWDKLIEITTTEGKKRFRTGEETDRIKEVFSQHLPDKFEAS